MAQALLIFFHNAVNSFLPLPSLHPLMPPLFPLVLSRAARRPLAAAFFRCPARPVCGPWIPPRCLRTPLRCLYNLRMPLRYLRITLRYSAHTAPLPAHTAPLPAQTAERRPRRGRGPPQPGAGRSRNPEPRSRARSPPLAMGGGLLWAGDINRSLWAGASSEQETVGQGLPWAGDINRHPPPPSQVPSAAVVPDRSVS